MIEKIADYYKLDALINCIAPEDLDRATAKAAHRARNMSLYVLHETTGQSWRILGNLFGNITPAGAYLAAQETKRNVDAGKSLPEPIIGVMASIPAMLATDPELILSQQLMR